MTNQNQKEKETKQFHAIFHFPVFGIESIDF